MTRTGEPRFCIIGAGAAGLSAADALRRRGYRSITVLEKDAARVGGKCRTVPFEGVPVDTGAIFVLPNYPTIQALARRVGVTLRRASRFVHVGEGGRIRPFGAPPRPVSLAAKVAEYGRLGVQLVKHRELLTGPLGQASPATVRAASVPLARWMETHRLDHFRDVAYPLLRSFGFGFEEQEIPTAYVLNIIPSLARGGNPASLWDLSAVDLYLIEEGYGEMWRRVASGLDVRMGVEIRSIERGDGGVRVRTAGGELSFDRLILACPLDDALAFLDASPEERRLFGKVRWIEIWQAPVRIEGVPHAALVDRNQVFARVGRPMIYFRYDPGWNVHYVCGYATGATSDRDIEAAVVEDVEAMGGRVLGTPAVARWRYFPHYAPGDLAAGCLSDLERLQGQRDTWYVGELVSNIGVESVASYAERLVERVWGDARG
ncbi:MAG: FAD-dependent oxidoreductase [Polyangiaceae bacterium]|nr:FAD-dependent oxidoreductase [Polyangiaceae bacterium]